MSRELAFILFGSAICLGSAVGVFFVVRYNRRLNQEHKRQSEAKNLAENRQ